MISRVRSERSPAELILFLFEGQAHPNALINRKCPNGQHPAMGTGPFGLGAVARIWREILCLVRHPLPLFGIGWGFLLEGNIGP